MGNSCCRCNHSLPDQLPSLKNDPNGKGRYQQSGDTPNKQKIVVGVNSYEAGDLEELSFKKGDRMEVLDESEGDRLLVRHLMTGKKRYIPGSFVVPELSVESEDWFFKSISRREAERLLLGDEIQPRGTFLIRPLEHNPNGYRLSVKEWEGDRGYHVKHYKIKPLDNGRFYIFTNKTFESLPELVVAYSKNAYGLCHVLSKPCRKPESMWIPDPTLREIPREDIQLIKKLGGGYFGEVFYGKWKNQYEVVVKTHRQMSTQTFLQVTAVMMKLRHKRFAQLYGICSTGEFYIVEEYMEKGSLLDYLRQDQGQTLKFDDLCYIAFQVANGMEHLETLNLIHRDLAARNVLLGQNNQAKICDFGLKRILIDEEYYARHRVMCPVKWMALEALMEGRFTIKSDVWSYGIFLMELYTFGESPYQGMVPRVFVDMVCGGYRMGKPEKHPLPDEIYQIMLKCWDQTPVERPTFQFLSNFFEHLDVSFADKSAIEGQSIVVQQNKPNTYNKEN